MAGGGIEVHADLTQMVQELKGTDKKFSASIRRRIRQAMVSAGDGMVQDARSRAGWSNRIPGAISVKTTLSSRAAKVVVDVNAKTAPHARPLELGNRTSFSESEISKRTVTIHGVQVGRRRAMAAMKRQNVGVGRMLRHPVYGHGGWASMATRPFFFPAAAEASVEAEKNVVKALDQIANDAGFK